MIAAPDRRWKYRDRSEQGHGMTAESRKKSPAHRAGDAIAPTSYFILPTSSFLLRICVPLRIITLLSAFRAPVLAQNWLHEAARLLLRVAIPCARFDFSPLRS